ncbi:hypothetical protein FQR65_LT06227 [Abscondita terminalis]|nr:hypothetical protein FQR65_LT06227 [Abscondita terminalis]
MLETRWKHVGNTLEKRWNNVSYTLETRWKHAGNTLETRWKHAGNTLETRWKHAGNTLETRWKHAGNTLETRWKHAGNTLETRWKHVGNTLETRWKHARNTLIEPKARPNNLLYAVGMVMRHLVFNYICVIYDWDRVCSASTEWQQQMGVHKLRLKDQQPFYNVLVEDGSQRYVAQGFLLLGILECRISDVTNVFGKLSISSREIRNFKDIPIELNHSQERQPVSTHPLILTDRASDRSRFSFINKTASQDASC